MPRYFFHLRDGRTSLDDEGTELPDIHAARRTAITLSGETLKDGASDTLWDGAPWQIWVTDQPDGKGQTFFTLHFSAHVGDEATP
jgi:hypothetical protein